MMADFKEVRDENGKLVKLKADISNFKSVAVNEYNNSSYCHISDVSKCFKKGGGFDISKSKSVTLNREDVDNFVRMIENIPAAMDQILYESKSDSSSSDSSSDDDNDKKKRKTNKRVKKTKTKTFKHIKAHPVSDASDSSENEDQKVQKKPKSQNKSKKRRYKPYSTAGDSESRRGKTPKVTESAKKVIKKKKQHVIESDSDTEILTDKIRVAKTHLA